MYSQKLTGSQFSLLQDIRTKRITKEKKNRKTVEQSRVHEASLVGGRCEGMSPSSYSGAVHG